MSLDDVLRALAPLQVQVRRCLRVGHFEFDVFTFPGDAAPTLLAHPTERRAVVAALKRGDLVFDR